MHKSPCNNANCHIESVRGGYNTLRGPNGKPCDSIIVSFSCGSFEVWRQNEEWPGRFAREANPVPYVPDRK